MFNADYLRIYMCTVLIQQVSCKIKTNLTTYHLKILKDITTVFNSSNLESMQKNFTLIIPERVRSTQSCYLTLYEDEVPFHLT